MLARVLGVLGDDSEEVERLPASQIVAGYLAAAALFGGLVSLFYYPGRIGPASIVISLIAVGMGTSIRRFAGLAFAVAAVGWLFGTIIAVLLDRPLF
jgi:hypothetical protein